MSYWIKRAAWNGGLAVGAIPPAAEDARTGDGAGVVGACADLAGAAQIGGYGGLAVGAISPAAEVASCGDGIGVSPSRADLVNATEVGRDGGLSVGIPTGETSCTVDDKGVVSSCADLR